MMTNYPDFTKTVYRLDSDNMIIEARTLEDVVRDSAEETTSPRGVEPVLFVEERDGEWQLRAWGHHGEKSSLLERFDTEEDAKQEWLKRTYEFDFLESEGAYSWCDSEDEAINDFVEYMNGVGEDDVTYDSVKNQIEDMKLDIENGKKAAADRMYHDMKAAYDFWKTNGQVTKKGRKLASAIKYDGYRHNGIWSLYIRYSDIVSEETMRMANEISK